MKKIIKYSSIVLVGIIVIVVLMFLFKICPPKGPWPTPPWCSQKSFEIKKYEVNVSAQKLTQVKAVNMSDTWGRNYNMGMVETTQSNISSSFDKVEKLGAKEVYVHDFHRAIYKEKTDFKSLDYTIEDETFWNDFRDESINEKDLKNLADEAHKRGLLLGIKHNMSFVNIGKYILKGITGDIMENVEKDNSELNSAITKEWTEDFFAKWQKRMVEKGNAYQKAGVDIMSITPTFVLLNFAGQEELVNQLNKNLISEVRKVFKGKIYAEINLYGLMDGYLVNENWNKYDFYKSADIKEVRIYNLPSKFEVNKNPNKAEILSSMSRFIQYLDGKAREKGIKLSIFFAPSSYENSINLGPVEVLDTRNEMIKDLKLDLDEQADAFQAMFEALSKTTSIERINAGNFAWDDALDPEVRPRISLNATFRNKPSEEVVQIWFSKN